MEVLPSIGDWERDARPRLRKSVTATEADKMEAKLRHIHLSGKSGKGISAANYAAQEAGGNPLDDIPF